MFLYSHGFTFIKEKDLGYDKEFDAFMSFSHEDGEFVIERISSGKMGIIYHQVSNKGIPDFKITRKRRLVEE